MQKRWKNYIFVIRHIKRVLSVWTMFQKRDVFDTFSCSERQVPETFHILYVTFLKHFIFWKSRFTCHVSETFNVFNVTFLRHFIFWISETFQFLNFALLKFQILQTPWNVMRRQCFTQTFSRAARTLEDKYWKKLTVSPLFILSFNGFKRVLFRFLNEKF